MFILKSRSYLMDNKEYSNFSYLMCKAGTFSLLFTKNNKIIQLNTVLNVEKKGEQIDFLLSSLNVI